MNYALDALWWRLTDKDVRALASILTAPALWQTGCELPVRQLLGEQGFRYLLELDSNPEPLKQHLAAEAPFGHRLGFYAESLLAFWLARAPHTQLLARNLPVRHESGKQTLGALDYVAKLNGVCYHIELTCKYYGSIQADPSKMVGLNADDRLADKAAKLVKQLALSSGEPGKAALRDAGIEADKCLSVSLVRGVGFAVEGQTFQSAPLNPNGWHGRYLKPGEGLPLKDDAFFYILPQMDLLAPARVEPEQCCDSTVIASSSDVLLALVEKRPDGMMHEILRMMKPAG
ncbi:DUF1853 family protein [Neisseria wadsworthii]|uniref:DUF1853 family protein n=1 Tax=Neisseria wadsworthii TaxID=607711 RepID=UPI000D2F7BD1|nr:DUF1853 family protein [Neisseria wadsworthii]